MNRTRILVVLAAAALVVAACGGGDSGGGLDADDALVTSASPDTTQPSETITPTTTTTRGPAPTTTKAPIPPASAPPPTDWEPGDDPVAFAIADLAGWLGVAAEDISLVEQVEVTWNDGSLGCPQPGMAYTQALVDGSRIVLVVEGVSYNYHSRAGHAPFYCANPGTIDKSG